VALGFWKAIEEAFPGTPTLLGSQDRQRPARLPRPPSTCSPTNTAPSYEKAVTKDREALLAFFGFPAGHWDHLRTSNPIESVFATVGHRTVLDEGIPVGDDRQVDGVQARHRGRKNLAAIEAGLSTAGARRFRLTDPHR